MRPRHQGRGEQDSGDGLGGRGGRFNAATAPRPWRTVNGRAYKPPKIALQCGHGTKAVENGHDGGSITLGFTRLKCGHGTKAVENVLGKRGDKLGKAASMGQRTHAR